MSATALDLPRTQADAIKRLAAALKHEALERDDTDFNDVDAVSERSILACHWQFTTCRSVALTERWPKKSGVDQILWTAGEPLAKFLNHFDFPPA